ncbi:MAG: ABC transporter ATP-binding protein [Gammaproteobacteria bacterium]
MSQPIIAIENASKSYRNGQQLALNDVSIQIEPATFVAVVGASGSGKTTLLKTMNRLADVDTGVVRVSGAAVNGVPGHELRRRVGYVFQGIGLFPHLTVAENIGITPRLLGWDAGQIVSRVEELADLVALPRSLLRRLPADLSGGQQQRVGVARALAAKPAILLMDEPFGALDPITRDALGTQVRNLHDAMELTTVMITHDVLEAVLLADRIVVMRAGRIIADGPPHTLLAGHPDEDVRALMEMPRRQAERVRAVLERNSRG